MVGVDESGCPLWTYHHNATSPCQCGSTADGIIDCNIKTGELRLKSRAYLTKDLLTNESIAGFSPYSLITNYYNPTQVIPMNSSSKKLCALFKMS